MRDSPLLSHYPDLGDRVYYLIREQILTGKMRPGSLLLGVELARDLGVSRTPVADALNVLAAEGLVEVVPRKGYFVATLDAQAYLHLMDARLAIELAALERGILRVSAAQIAALKRQIDLMKGCLDAQGRLGDHLEWMQCDAEFHGLLVGASGNPYLVEMYNQLSARIRLAHLRFTSSKGPRPSAQVLTEHEMILAAFESGDLAAAADGIGKHLNGTAQFYAASGAGEGGSLTPREATVPERRSMRLPWFGRGRLAEQP